MPLGELPDAERTCKRCEYDDDEAQATCGGCSRAWSGGHIEGALNDYWSEKGRSVRERAEKLIAELEIRAKITIVHLAKAGLFETIVRERDEARAEAEKLRGERNDLIGEVGRMKGSHEDDRQRLLLELQADVWRRVRAERERDAALKAGNPAVVAKMEEILRELDETRKLG
jgi:hypothetical protein